MTRLLYFGGRALKGIRQALFVNVVAVLTIAIALFVVAVFAGGVSQIRALIDRWGEDIVVAVYLKEDLTDDALAAVGAEVTAAAGAGALVDYVSKEVALERLRSSLGEDAAILEGLQRNPLPASLEVRGGVTKEGMGALESLAERLGELPGVQDVDYGREWVGRLEGLVTLVGLAGAFVGGLILLAAMVTVSNTIKLAVFARKDEIEIMKLCGATDGFVRAPFLIEGLIQGVLGALLAVVTSVLLWAAASPGIERGLAEAFAMQAQVAMPLSVLALLLPSGALLGFLGAAVSLGRFLRV